MGLLGLPLNVYHGEALAKPTQRLVFRRGFGVEGEGSLAVMRTLTSLVLALVCAPALASCSDDTPKAEPVVTAQLPDNLCDAVPSSVVERWRLVEKDHATNESEDRNEASCSMTGEADGEPVTLGVSLTAFGAADKDAARQLMTADLEQRCDALEESGTGAFEDEDSRCSSETPGRPAAQRGQVTEYSLAIPAHGVVSVTMQHRGRGGCCWRPT